MFVVTRGVGWSGTGGCFTWEGSGLEYGVGWGSRELEGWGRWSLG